MKSAKLTGFAATMGLPQLMYLAVIAFALMALPIPLAAQAASGEHSKHHHYKLIDVGTFGGPTNIVSSAPDLNVINGAGTVVGGADTSVPTPEPGCYNPILNPDCFIFHAFVWRDQGLNDLGTLHGGNFSFATEINQRGLIAGVSENGRIDPTSGNPEFRAVVWQNDKIRDLGTFGGTASVAGTLNDLGQVTGVALNDVYDPYSLLGLGSEMTLTQTRGFLWQNGSMRDLGTLGGPDTWAGFVNNNGQVAGASFTSDVADPTTGTPPVGVFLWQNGRMKNLGDLGGNNGRFGAYNLVSGLNDSGQVVGSMVLAGDQFIGAFLWNGQKLLNLGALGGDGSLGRGVNDAGHVVGLALLPGDQVNHGFLWRNGVMTDLGTLGGDPCSDALAVNLKDQVVGASQSAAGGCNEWTTAFLWENGGPSVDLNSLVLADSEAHLYAGFWTNRKGEIVAGGIPTVCNFGETCNHSYLLIPCDEEHPGVDGCDYSLVDTTTAAEAGTADLVHAPSFTLEGSDVPSRFLDRLRRRMGVRYAKPIVPRSMQ